MNGKKIIRVAHFYSEDSVEHFVTIEYIDGHIHDTYTENSEDVARFLSGRNLKTLEVDNRTSGMTYYMFEVTA